MPRCLNDNGGYTDEFAERLNYIMEKRGYTSGHLALRTGLSEQVIRHYQSGYTQAGGYALKMLAKGLGVSADWLLGLQEEEN